MPPPDTHGTLASAVAYAGIGSRRTPDDVLVLMYAIARMAAARGLWLYSGHADGADWAFERGAGGRATIFLPWRGFGNELGQPRGQALRIAARHGIPVLNLQRDSHRARIEQWLSQQG